MAVFWFCVLICAAICGLVVLLTPRKQRYRPRPKSELSVGALLLGIGPLRLRRALAAWLDVLLVLAFSGWYAVATRDAPRGPSPSTDQIYELPVVVGSIGGNGGGRFSLHALLFGPGYVDLTTAIIGWAVFANAALLLLWALFGFLHALWSDPPPRNGELFGPPVDDA